MIIKAKHNFLIYNFFKFYLKFIIKKYFSGVNVYGSYIEKNLPILIIANHISWWDGFWVMYLNMKIFKRKFYFMMLEEQLKKYWYFKYCGGYSIKKNSKSIIESLKYSIEILSNPKNLLMLFPQGKIESQHKHIIEFEKGVEKIIKQLKNPVQIIFEVNLVDYYSNKKPTLNIFFQEVFIEDLFNLSIKSISEKYNSFFQNCIDKQIKI